MALVYCPNCKSANSGRERRCWICQKALAPPPANPSGRPLTYPQKMRLVRFEETANGSDGSVAARVVYVKSIEDDRPVKDYWEALRDQQMLKLRRIYAGTAAALTVALVGTLFALSAPASTQPPITPAPRVVTYVLPDNPLAHTILPPPPTYAPYAGPVYDQVRPTRFQAM